MLCGNRGRSNTRPHFEYRIMALLSIELFAFDVKIISILYANDYDTKTARYDPEHVTEKNQAGF